MNNSSKEETDKLLEVIIEAIQEKQGRDILSINLTSIQNNISEYFVVCHADSTTQVNAIADNIQLIVKKKLDDRVWHAEGKDNLYWVLLDYSNIVVHVFQKEHREYYNLEGLWADAKIIKYSSDN